MDTPTYLTLKRLLDVIVAGVGLLLLLPLFAVVAAAIKLDSSGPVFFRQQRLGLNGRPFTFVKFRSMTVGADSERQDVAHLNEQDGPIFKIRHDPRITRVGRYLRKLSIDELPQLWHVFCGQMTLVGPRPPIPDEVALYEPWQRERLSVVPGLTCTWQISGRSHIPFERWVEMDIEYIRSRSLWCDLRILAQTLPAVVTGRGAY